jgi:hypothetical protein
MQFWLAYAAAHIVIAGVLGHAILLPLVRRAGALSWRLRFRTIDFVVLLLLLLLVWMLSMQEDSAGKGSPLWTFFSEPMLVLSLPCTFAMWCGSVSVVTKARVVRPLPRFTVIALIIPGTLVVITVAPILIATATALAAAPMLSFVGLEPAAASPPAGSGGPTLLAMTMIVMAIALHLLSTWAASLPEGFVEEDGGGDGEVEAVDAAQEGQADRLNVVGPP